MALLQLGPLASAVAGSLAGTTIQRGRAGFQLSSPDITRDYTLAHRVLPDPSRACHTLFRFVHKGTGWPGPLFASQATI